MKKDFIITFINYAFVFVCGVLLYKLAASGFGPVGFGEYALSKRAVSFLQPILQMGLSVGLVRYIAIAPGGPEGAARRASYVVSGFACITLFSLVLLGVLNLVPGAFGKLVFGGPGYVSYVRLVSLLAAASIVNLLAFTYYRGKGSFVAANALMALAQGLLPLLSVAFARSPGQALALNAAGVFAVSAAFLAPALAESLPKMSLADLVPSLRELLRYGTARVPGDLSMAAMLALPAFLTANMYGVKEAGYVAFGVTLVNITGAMFGPIGFIMLPRLSSFLSQGRTEVARSILRRIMGFTTLVSLAATAAIVLAAGFIADYWLGEGFSPAAGVIRVAALAAVPNAVFVSLRSSIDAAYVEAINASNVYKALAVSLAAYAVVRFWDVGLYGVPAAFFLGMLALAALTFRVALTTYKVELSWRSIRTWT